MEKTCQRRLEIGELDKPEDSFARRARRAVVLAAPRCSGSTLRLREDAASQFDPVRDSRVILEWMRCALPWATLNELHLRLVERAEKEAGREQG